MTPHVFEGKYELDSLAAVLKLANAFVKQVKNNKYNSNYHGNNNSDIKADLSCIDNVRWLEAVHRIVDTVKLMQAGYDFVYYLC
jgi:meiotically up-regulated gene 157 (Mug157) protein